MSMPVLPVLSVLLVALQAAPLPFEDLSALEARVIAAAGAAIGAPGGPTQPLDRRLRLRRCAAPAEIAPVRGGLSVACAAQGWRLHVALSGAPTGSGGAQANQQSGPVIRRGDAVAVRMQGRGFSVVLRAVALEDGAMGARIRLRRANGPTMPITGIVTGPGEASPAT